MNTALESELERHETKLEETLDSMRILRKFRTIEGISYAYSYIGDSVEIEVDQEHLQAALKSVLKITGAKRGTKSINPFSGALVYTFKSDTLTVEVRTKSTRCKVKRVTKKVWEAPRAGYYHDETKYVVENPEECLGVDAEALLNGQGESEG